MALNREKKSSDLDEMWFPRKSSASFFPHKFCFLAMLLACYNHGIPNPLHVAMLATARRYILMPKLVLLASSTEIPPAILFVYLAMILQRICNLS